MILNGELQAGDRLPTEADFCVQRGVSRTSVREALQQLKGRGLIESTAGRGMFVRSIEPKVIEKELQLFAQVEQDPQAFFELVDFRLLIEPENARVAAKDNSPEFIEELAALLEKMRSNTENLDTFMEADLDMHLCIAKKAGNRFVKMVLSCLKPLGKRFGHLNHNHSDFIQETLIEHTRILDALRDGNSRSAPKAMREHLLSSRQHFRDLIN